MTFGITAPGRVAVFATLLAATACTTDSGARRSDPDMGITWVRDSAEFRALSLQAYGQAGRDLEGMLADANWSALPGQESASDLPPAIILDVDETSVSNVRFQETLVPPFRDDKLTRWSEENHAVALPGAVEFVQMAAAAGVEVFFVTNRPCTPSGDDPCPQEAVVIGDLTEAGFVANPANVMLSGEQPGWSKEKSIRRQHIAEQYRVIMLFGDDLGDFIDCTRKRALEPCTAGATRASRHSDTTRAAEFWGNGWYVLPNPMHGSWTSME